MGKIQRATAKTPFGKQLPELQRPFLERVETGKQMYDFFFSLGMTSMGKSY